MTYFTALAQAIETNRQQRFNYISCHRAIKHLEDCIPHTAELVAATRRGWVELSVLRNTYLQEATAARLYLRTLFYLRSAPHAYHNGYYQGIKNRIYEALDHTFWETWDRETDHTRFVVTGEWISRLTTQYHPSIKAGEVIVQPGDSVLYRSKQHMVVSVLGSRKQPHILLSHIVDRGTPEEGVQMRTVQDHENIHLLETPETVLTRVLEQGV